MLVNLYAKHYNPQTAADDPGVPMHLVPDINALLGRSTVKEVYDQMEADLLEATKLLPTQRNYKNHPVQASAEGMLAKLYLYKVPTTKPCNTQIRHCNTTHSYMITKL